MKSIKHQSKGRILKIAFAFVLMAGLTNAALANTAEPEKEAKKADKELIEKLAQTFDANYVLPGQEKVDFKIYDNQDNLVHQVTLLKNDISKDKKLSKLLHKADLVMKMGSTQYFKIN